MNFNLSLKYLIASYKTPLLPSLKAHLQQLSGYFSYFHSYKEKIGNITILSLFALLNLVSLFFSVL